MIKVDISDKKSYFSLSNRLSRVIWGVAYIVFFRFSPRPFHLWRNVLLRMFGAKLHRKARIYPSAKIYAPWNLIMHQNATLGDGVYCYCVTTIEIGANSTISQFSFLCGADHDYEHSRFPLKARPIKVGEQCWLAADVFVAPGVTIGDGTVVGARSSVFRDLPPWKVCAGTPAKVIKDRIIKQ
ncbi:MAG TPA: putative colanic acid biosynthesis acetyltransferase [Marinilabiliales bacterium]|nr:MAG: acetyltransferase [Bacteroidetes bacterium GWA2_40_14]OFX57575.1 MAG: acetyltransferase [Bacteroidetes bacterium GWC2_40_13]OFX73246.1 MAG: acetyltransferase [Bacteroidetes bacterium GWD2_40_43]OFX92101.1 MAG: acetyltransferase [Bacteroidetes bacterium GWE2_40_63]OFY16725.1 MAG: acetyltransferase [Bacteroidetes bacterium GWF2_40_13]OFZ30621.1 MAG: acetyltransferase [Bacteroidetes bacterium RIFOXYC2_FULL_40_12]HAM98944.1 putative colanic acid biosynthesis acetyltransferase [Marinilabil